jgi:hypothetical protein
MMAKYYDIRHIDQLHQLRYDNYEATKGLSPGELVAQSNRAAAPLFERLTAMRHEYLVKQTAARAVSGNNG